MLTNLRDKCYSEYRSGLRAGKISRPKFCDRCGSKCQPDGHHKDYSQPLKVLWLCKNCHQNEHKISGKNKATKTMKLDGIKLKEWIEARGMKINWFAKQLGMSPQRLSVILNNRIEQPKYPDLIIEKAASILKIRIEDITIEKSI